MHCTILPFPINVHAANIYYKIIIHSKYFEQNTIESMVYWRLRNEFTFAWKRGWMGNTPSINLFSRKGNLEWTKKWQSPLSEGKIKAGFWPKLRERNARIRKTFAWWVLSISFEECKKKSQGRSKGFFRGTHNSPNSFPPRPTQTSLIKDLVTL